MSISIVDIAFTLDLTFLLKVLCCEPFKRLIITAPCWMHRLFSEESSLWELSLSWQEKHGLDTLTSWTWRSNGTQGRCHQGFSSLFQQPGEQKGNKTSQLLEGSGWEFLYYLLLGPEKALSSTEKHICCWLATLPAQGSQLLKKSSDLLKHPSPHVPVWIGSTVTQYCHHYWPLLWSQLEFFLV